MTQVLDPVLRDLTARRQTVADELSEVLQRFSRQPHEYMGEATMIIMAHKADVFMPPRTVANVGFLSLHTLPTGREVIVLRLATSGITALGEYDRATKICAILKAPRFVEVFVPTNASPQRQESGFEFVAMIKHLMEMFTVSI